MKYSFVIPVYNCEKYLRECFDSVLSQSFRDFEIIAVDDGSKDQSGKICDEYAVMNTCMRVFHLKNGGVSAARNFGVSHAEGEYVIFVDSDDVISPVMLERAEKITEDFDVLFFGHTRESQANLSRILLQSAPEKVDTALACDNVLYCIKEDGTTYNCSTVWAKIFKRDIIGNIKFISGITIGEDKLFNFSAFSKANNIMYLPDVMYFCRPNQNSAMHSFSKDYRLVAERTFEEFEKLIADTDNKHHYQKLLSLRSLKVMRNTVALEICNPSNIKKYRERKREFVTVRSESLTGKYFAACDGVGASDTDNFFRYIYKKNFFRIELMTKYKAFKAIEYALYKVFGKK